MQIYIVVRTAYEKRHAIVLEELDRKLPTT